MRQLHVVGVSSDGRQLLFASAPDARPSHAVLIDRRLERAVRGQPLEEGAEPAVILTPKDIQARLRAGESVEQVARTAGVPLARVERYAGPVLSEREQLLDAVRAATFTRARGGRSRLPLGAAVEANLAATAFVRPETSRWTAYRRADNGWVARLEVTVRGRRRQAEWLHEPGGRGIVALDAYASAVGHVGDVPVPADDGGPSAGVDYTPVANRAAGPVAKKAPGKKPGAAGRRRPNTNTTETNSATATVRSGTPAARPAQPARPTKAAAQGKGGSALPPSIRGLKAGPLPPAKKARRPS